MTARQEKVQEVGDGLQTDNLELEFEDNRVGPKNF
jgi:hypothetical protein